MIGPKRRLYALTLNALAAFALGGVANSAYMQNAHAASQDDDVKLKQFIRQSCGKGSPARLKNKCAEAQEQSYRNDVAKWNLDLTNDAANQALLRQLKDEYQKQVQKSQDIQKAKSNLESTNSVLEKKNRALRKQASQACSVASSPGNEVQSAGLAATQSLGEHQDVPPQLEPRFSFPILDSIEGGQ
jgi:hypothetical protein